MPFSLLPLLLLALLTAAAASAGDLESWNLVEATVAHGQRWRVDAVGFLRLKNRVSDAYDEAPGTRFTYVVTPRVSLYSAFLHRWVDKDGDERIPERRPLAGVILTVSRQPVRVDLTTQYERLFYTEGRASYNRYRQRVEIERTRRRVSPVLSQELIFVNDGLFRARTIAGIRCRTERGRRFDIGYQLDSTLTRGAWAPRHAIRTAFLLGNIFRGD